MQKSIIHTYKLSSEINSSCRTFTMYVDRSYSISFSINQEYKFQAPQKKRKHSNEGKKNGTKRARMDDAVDK